MRRLSGPTPRPAFTFNSVQGDQMRTLRARAGQLGLVLATTMALAAPGSSPQASGTALPAPGSRDSETRAAPRAADSPAPTPAAWVEVEPPGEGFRAAFPGDPEHDVESSRTAIGKMTSSRYIYETPARHYSIERHRMPRLGRMLAPGSLILSRTRDSILDGRDAEEISYVAVPDGAHSMRVLRLRSRDGRSPFEQTRLFLVGRDIFLVTVETGEDEASQAAARRFFRSFRIREGG